MSAGSEFHTVGAVTRKLRAPKLSLYDVIDNKLDWLERKLRPGTWLWSKHDRYNGALLLRALKDNYASLNYTVLNR